MNIRRPPIKADFYKKILEAVPLLCADAVVVHRGKFLLGKRRNKPARGQWFLVGGRVLKGELLRDAVRRKVKEETGIERFVIKRFLGVGETFFKNSEFGPSTHNVNAAFLVEVPRLGGVESQDGQNSEFKWFWRVSLRWHPYVKEMLRLAGFK